MIAFFAGHRTAALLLLVAFVAAGVIGLPGLQRETFPEFAPERIEVRMVYPGAATDEVEQALCLRIEDALGSLTGIREQSCSARQGQAVATIELLESADPGRLLIEIKTEIEAIDGLPDAVETPVVRHLDTTDRVVSLALSAPAASTDLQRLADDLKTRLMRLPDVARVDIDGFATRELRIALDEPRLRALGLSVGEIVDLVARRSLDLPLGTLETHGRDISMRLEERRETAIALEDLVLREGPAGGVVRLGDVATIVEHFVDNGARITFDDRPAALLVVHKAKGDDSLRTMAAVADFVEDERLRLPPEVHLTATEDTASLIRERLMLLAVNGAQGFALVVAVMLVFFSLRFAATVAMALPLSFLASFFVIAQTGHSINVLSTVGLLIAIGLLIDSAIVITENVATHMRRGVPALRAAVDGTREVAAGVVSSFLTSICVFAPLGFLEGDLGRVLRVVPIVLVITLSASLIVSFSILPRFAAQALAKERRGRLRAGFDAGFDRFRSRVLGRIVDLAIAWRYLTVGAMLGLLIASIGLLAGGVLKIAAFPDVEGDVVEARLMMIPGTPEARTEAVVDHVLDALARTDRALAPTQPEGRPPVAHVRIDRERNPDYADRGPHQATIRVDLTESESRDVSTAELLDIWRSEIAALSDVVSLTLLAPTPSPAGRPIDMRLSGEDLGVLAEAGRALAGWLGRYDGVEALTVDLHPGPPELRVVMRDGAQALGIDASTVARQLRAAFQGEVAQEIQQGRDSIELRVRLAEQARGSLGDLEDFVITLPEGTRVPLASVARFEETRGHVVVPRIEGRRTVSVRGEVDARRVNANEVLADTEARFLPELLQAHPGLEVAYDGQIRRQAETAGSLRRAFAIGLIGMFIVLSFQFRSLIEPVVVMLAIPLALIGVIWGHVAMGIELSMPSLVGFASLAGIVVNNSILLVVFLKGHAGAGRPVAEAAREAVLDRFRPILMTSATTIAGLLPILLERSLQAQILVPLVTSLAFGLLAATILVLVFVPALYAILDDFGYARLALEDQDGDVTVPNREHARQFSTTKPALR